MPAPPSAILLGDKVSGSFNPPMAFNSPGYICNSEIVPPLPLAPSPTPAPPFSDLAVTLLTSLIVIIPPSPK